MRLWPVLGSTLQVFLFFSFVSLSLHPRFFTIYSRSLTPNWQKSLCICIWTSQFSLLMFLLGLVSFNRFSFALWLLSLQLTNHYVKTLLWLSRLVYSQTGPQMLPATEGEVEVVHIQDKHTKRYRGQNKPHAFVFFSRDTSRRNQIRLREQGWCRFLLFLSCKWKSLQQSL